MFFTDEKDIPPQMNAFKNTFYVNDMTIREAFLQIY